MIIGTENFWEHLLDLIEEGNILPVVGQGVTTMDPDDSLLAPWLAARLAEKLDISPDKLPADPTLHHVICRHLIDGGERDDIRGRLYRILKDPPKPGLTLRRLASIGGFRLFISTTFDPLLAMALNEVRHAGHPITAVHAYSPEAADKDLPKKRRELLGSTVFHLMGKVSASDNYVAWEEDVLEFVCGLHQHMSVLPNLAQELADKKLRILVLGLNYADWEVRFFLRVVRQSRLSGMDRVDYLAECPTGALTDSMVMFFGDIAKPGGAVKNIKVIPCDPREFVAELARRWAVRHPVGQVLATSSVEPPPVMPRGAVFISYVREDETAVKALKAGLEAYGCEVWYDRERLKSGTNFNYELEDEVKQRCSLFVSVISRNTESQHEAYFHRERNWAAQRALSYPDALRAEFYHPVVIDGVPLDEVRYEPRAFDGCHRTHLPDGEVSPEFGQRLVDLQRRRQRGESA